MTTEPYTITLSKELIEKLSAQVELPNQAAINEFIADAVNTYLHLGKLKLRGGDFFFCPDDRDEQIKLHFPFSR